MIAIGVDVGGTSIKGAAVDSNGKVYEVFSMPTDKNMKGEEVVNKLCQLIKNYINEQKFEEAILGIGIGIPGVIDSENGIVGYSANLPLWENLHIKELMEKASNIEFSNKLSNYHHDYFRNWCRWWNCIKWQSI